MPEEEPELQSLADNRRVPSRGVLALRVMGVVAYFTTGAMIISSVGNWLFGELSCARYIFFAVFYAALLLSGGNLLLRASDNLRKLWDGSPDD